jgi:putative tryptophan/tyrosine transport system substrate-binding protein
VTAGASILLAIAVATILAAVSGETGAQAKRVVGFWMGPCEVTQGRAKQVAEAMARIGWTQPRKLRVEPRCVPPSLEAAAAAAREVAASRPDAIVTHGTGATLALMKATTTIPIVTNVGDAVAIGMAKEMSRPGGNVTGLSQDIAGTAYKQMEILRRLLPRLQRVLAVGMLGGEYAHVFQAAAKRQGLATIDGSRMLDEVRHQLASLPPDGTAAVYIANLGPDTATLVKEALARRLPVMAYNPEQVEEGEALVSYQLEWRDPWARQAAALDKILRGARPADMPFEQPTESFLAINRKTAARLGIEIPADLLLQANWTN